MEACISNIAVFYRPQTFQSGLMAFVITHVSYAVPRPRDTKMDGWAERSRYDRLNNQDIPFIQPAVNGQKGKRSRGTFSSWTKGLM